jgi:hypothetical protein
LVRLIATDLDGTLLRSDGEVSERTRRALVAARDAGVTIVLISWEPPAGTRYADALELVAAPVTKLIPATTPAPLPSWRRRPARLRATPQRWQCPACGGEISATGVNGLPTNLPDDPGDVVGRAQDPPAGEGSSADRRLVDGPTSA